MRITRAAVSGSVNINSIRELSLVEAMGSSVMENGAWIRVAKKGQVWNIQIVLIALSHSWAPALCASCMALRMNVDSSQSGIPYRGAVSWRSTRSSRHAGAASAMGPITDLMILWRILFT